MSQDADDDTTGSASDQDFAPLPIDLLPWHESACDKLTAAVASRRLAHGLLLQGPAGVGKERFASALAAALFCTGRGERLVACGECAECLLSRAGTHPDLHWLRIPDDRKSIGVDQVRYFDLQGDRLILKTPRMVIAGVEGVGTLVWERLP